MGVIRMKQWVKTYFASHMIRPVVYKTFTRFIYALTLALLWNRFVRDKTGFPSHWTHTFVVPGMLFLAMAWSNYLWLDGIRPPIAIKGRLAQLQQVLKKRRSDAFSSISDYVDTELISFDELSEDERRACNLISNLTCALLFLTWSLT